eukprot:8334839-Lingulodinium_polyedra.AAC.1
MNCVTLSVQPLAATHDVQASHAIALLLITFTGESSVSTVTVDVHCSIACHGGIDELFWAILQFAGHCIQPSNFQ